MRAIEIIKENNITEIIVEESCFFGLIKTRTKYSKITGGGWLKEPDKTTISGAMYVQLMEWEKRLVVISNDDSVKIKYKSTF